jgi:hypothetical protein
VAGYGRSSQCYLIKQSVLAGDGEPLTRVALLIKIYEMLIESVRCKKIRLLEVGKSILEITKPDVGRRK